jgi:hypothetical protein
VKLADSEIGNLTTHPGVRQLPHSQPSVSIEVYEVAANAVARLVPPSEQVDTMSPMTLSNEPALAVKYKWGSWVARIGRLTCKQRWQLQGGRLAEGSG